MKLVNRQLKGIWASFGNSTEMMHSDGDCLPALSRTALDGAAGEPEQRCSL